ncbi:uncharacterized protein BDW43DRAFT_295086 [Aspergillus alliaceus]|uniref:uncharacterized protein n=1 Tax=Petromyces alliaceus TaxID=209559 RepID=UPI0012A6F46F|nr:uncharacterized protein BDW43DRAFT_295086 [Aspergillus alliaceus]KAB8227047.1 hypothetical protein BDW43DRAFT_295086 [Aspergillus alliaceus]
MSGDRMTLFASLTEISFLTFFLFFPCICHGGVNGKSGHWFSVLTMHCFFSFLLFYFSYQGEGV